MPWAIARSRLGTRLSKSTLLRIISGHDRAFVAGYAQRTLNVEGQDTFHVKVQYT